MLWIPRDRRRTAATAAVAMAAALLAAWAARMPAAHAAEPPRPAPVPIAAASSVAAPPAAPPGAEAGAAKGEAAPAPEREPLPVSASARQLYESARPRLLQVRTLLKGQDSQSSVGSGALVGAGGLILTNYHVVSQAAWQPQRYRLSFAMADGQKGGLDLVAVDVVHDLALVRMVQPPAAVADRGVLEFRAANAPLAQGERIYSLGNPLDVGFAVVEGTYNGMVERSFLPQILFSGALSPGMSGGPVLDQSGRIIGVNVATRRDGQLVSFLVPGSFARALIDRGGAAKAITGTIHAELARQLARHQDELTTRFIALPWKSVAHAHYSLPVPQEEFMRCWGATSTAETQGLEFERSSCRMESEIYINQELRTGYLEMRHEVYDGRRLGTLRFNEQYSRSFANEDMGRRTRMLTAPQCREGFVENQGLPMRTVMCLRGYRKLPGLFDVAVLTTSVDAAMEGVQGRFDAHGVSYDNALRLARHYLQGFAGKHAP